MKKKIVAALFILMAAANFVFAKKASTPLPLVQEKFELNKTNRQLGYQLLDGGKKIVFVFDASYNRISQPDSVFVTGSFNGWTKTKSSVWECEKVKGKNVWTLECDAEEIKIPGNSGFPEFKFNVWATVKYTETVCGKTLYREKKEMFQTKAVSRIPGFQMATNNLILFSEDDVKDVIKNQKIANTVLKKKNFDLKNENDCMKICNMRVVPGTTKLYRGYHPYVKSRNEFDTESVRMKLIPELLEQNGIQSLITLSGEENSVKNIPPYVKGISIIGNHGVFNTSYNTVYYKSNGLDFGKLIQSVVFFINTHSGPYYIHCRLGTDRTGVVSAVLAALCGASWDEIVADYQKSNELGIKEFRDYRLLQFSFERILGKSIDEVEDLQAEISSYFVKKNFLTQEQINELRKRL